MKPLLSLSHWIVLLITLFCPLLMAATIPHFTQPTPSPAATVAETNDSTINSSVQTSLSRNTRLHGSTISATTVGGVVTLDGTVNTQEQATEAIQQTKNIPGVKNVQSKLSISASPINPNTPTR